MILAKRLARVYLRIGAILAALVWSSFAYALLFAATAPLGDRLWGLLLVQPAALMSAVLRLLFWLPSAMMWTTAPDLYTLVIWLAPGLYLGPASQLYAP
jgi:hypothetical protein